ncbi:hypothetical protein Bpla01_59510 [Burkholderia plantarii]|nr:hypothetical protein Bpla01_59510 [Burkholderia plantarii]
MSEGGGPVRLTGGVTPPCRRAARKPRALGRDGEAQATRSTLSPSWSAIQAIAFWARTLLP